MKYIRLRHIILFLLMAVFGTPVRAGIQTDYLLGGNYVYNNGSQWYLKLDCGEVSLTGSTSASSYYYDLKDYQGNVRMAVKSGSSSPFMTDYYPYGGVIRKGKIGTHHRLFIGKELDKMHGLNWYDFGARMYDPTLGRFMTMDPLAEKYYPFTPYAYCAGDPVNKFDPDGKVIVIEYKASDNNYYSLPFNGSGKYVYPKSQFVKDFFAAYNYNINNGGGKYMKKAAEDPNNIYYLRDATDPNAVETQETGFNPQEGKSYITWESRMGLKTTEGGHQSAATRLEHEFYHAVDNAQNPSLRRTKSITPDSQYDYLEEREAINAENDTAIHNNEDPRNDHKGTPYPTVSPTSIQPK